MENPDFLKKKYWDKPEFREAAEESAEKKERLEGEGFSDSQKSKEQISAYIERIKRIAENKGEFFRETSLYPKFIIKPENITDNYIKNIILGNFAEMKGYDRSKLQDAEIKKQILSMFEKETGNNFETYQVPEEEKEKLAEQAINDQKASLDRWFEYLTGPEARNYPDEFKYWAFAEMLKLGAQDRKRKTFNKRAEETAASFPPLNQQALARVLDEMLRKQTGKPSALNLSEEQKKDFQKRLQSENFGKLYGWALDYVNSLKLPTERLPIIEGEWRKFSKGTNPKELVDSILEFNTGWCIDGEGTAESYLSHSDVWVYFSQDADGENSIPRAAIIHKDNNSVTEVRGIIQKGDLRQHLDDYITPVVDEKLKTLPGGENWQGQMEDMKKLAEIHFKHIQNKPLSKDDLTFLYEIDKPISQTGYGRDPRIEELRSDRNIDEDMIIIFECTKEQIAHNADEVNENTKAYIGEWNPTIYQKIKNYPNIKHLYESFPEEKIFMHTLETDPNINSPEKAEQALEGKNIYLGKWVKDILYKTEFNKDGKTYELVQFTVGQLGFPNGATTDEIYAKAQELGLQLAPAEVGPHLRLAYPGTDWKLIAMKQIIDHDGYPHVFSLSADVIELKLLANDAAPGNRWNADDHFVFLSRKEI